VPRRPRKHRIKCARPSCDERFTPGRRDQKYHSSKCRNAHWRELHPRVMIVHETSPEGGVTKARTGRTAVVRLHEKVRTR
jgi:hypothetical protein